MPTRPEFKRSGAPSAVAYTSCLHSALGWCRLSGGPEVERPPTLAKSQKHRRRPGPEAAKRARFKPVGLLRASKRNHSAAICVWPASSRSAVPMNSIVYLVGLVVIVIAILSFIGLR